MRLAPTALVLASFASVTNALGFPGVQNGLEPGQTTSDFKCKSAQKSFLQCALSNDFDFNKDVWKDTTAASCYSAANTAFTGCRGGMAYEVNGAPSNPQGFAYPSYAVTAGVSKMGQVKGQVLIPSGDPVAATNNNHTKTSKSQSGLTKDNTLTVSCQTCTKLIQNVMKCALPVTVNAGDPNLAYFAAVSGCLSTPKDRVLFDLCQPNAKTPLTLNSNKQLSYVIAGATLSIGSVNEVCPSVEYNANSKGGESAKVLKASVGTFVLPPI